MGIAKEQMMKEQARGWTSLGDKYVCPACFADAALKRFVKEHAAERECNYCGKKSRARRIAAPIDEVVAFINEGVLTQWTDAVGELPYDSREGGYQGTVLDSWDLFGDELGDCFNNDTLLEDIIDAYSNREFCQRDYFALTPSDALRFGWEEFSRVVKHKTRFLFLAERGENSGIRSDDGITPANFLDHLGNVITDAGLVRTLSIGTRFHRVRVHDRSEHIKSARDLGPVPQEKAHFSNRMSPAGISLFYGATDRSTAIKETYDPDKKEPVRITCGQFAIARDFPICDFTDLPPIPSLFDEECRHEREPLLFLHGFVRDLSKPVSRDGREHVEYVPTQVVTEYLRRVYSHPEFGAVRGILYRSAQQSNGICCALFFGNDDCTDLHPGWEAEMQYGQYKWWLGLDTGAVVRTSPHGTGAGK